MVLERAIFTVKEGSDTDFVRAFDQAKEIIGNAAGLQSLRLLKGIEKPNTFLLLIEWESLEAHVEGFQKSEDFGKFVGLLAPHFGGEPDVGHYEPLLTQ